MATGVVSAKMHGKDRTIVVKGFARNRRLASQGFVWPESDGGIFGDGKYCVILLRTFCRR